MKQMSISILRFYFNIVNSNFWFPYKCTPKLVKKFFLKKTFSCCDICSKLPYVRPEQTFCKTETKKQSNHISIGSTENSWKGEDFPFGICDCQCHQKVRLNIQFSNHMSNLRLRQCKLQLVNWKTDISSLHFTIWVSQVSLLGKRILRKTLVEKYENFTFIS